MERPENNNWLDEALAETIGSEKSRTDFEKWKQQHPDAVKMLTSRVQGTPVSKHPFNIRNIIMKRSITKLAAAVVIITAVLIVINPFNSNGTSTAWAQVAEKVQQLHRNYVEELLAAVEAKDVEKIEFYADMLDEFWQKLGWLARAKSDLEIRAQVIAQAKAISEDRDISDAMGIQMFLANSEEFLDWLEQIEDATWIDETIYVCKQIEEYSEEIRDGAASSDPVFPYVEHCMSIFATYVEWFDQLPWLNPKQEVTTTRLLKMLKRDLETAHQEVLYSELNSSNSDTIRFLHRCIEQAEKNAGRIVGKTESQDTVDSSQTKKCKNLARYTKELSDLITYASIARWSIQEVDKVNTGQAYLRVLRNDFWSGGTFGDYLIERIERSSDLCNELLNEFGSQQ